MDPIEAAHQRITMTFNFRVTLRKTGVSASATPQAGSTNAGQAAPDFLGDGGFQECSGLDIEMDAQELPEGGRNNGVVRLAGRGKYSNIVLKRGMFFAENGGVNVEFWRWMQSILSGVRPVARYDGLIEALDNSGRRTLARWTFTRGLPVKVAGPQLNAKSGEVAIEELHIAHEGLRLEV
jgi:phage tail-like protein